MCCYIYITILIVLILDGILLLPEARKNTGGSTYSENVKIFKRDNFYGERGTFGMCSCEGPYNLDVPNMEAALSGFNLPLSNPFDTKNADPGWRSVIFDGIERNGGIGDTIRPPNIQKTHDVSCNGVREFTEITSWRQFQSFQKESNSLGVDFQTNSQTKIDASVPVGGVTVGLKTEIPPLVSFGYGRKDSSSSVEAFFNQEKGAMMMMQQKCFKYQVRIPSYMYSTPPLYAGFKKAMKELSATPSDTWSRIQAFKKFTREYGTHFSKYTQMGSSFSLFISITEQERQSIKKEDLNECSHTKAVRVFGFQTDRDTQKCSSSALNEEQISSNYVSRTIISTKGGTPIYTNGEWGMQADAVPVPVKMVFVPLYELFTDSLFKTIGINKNAEEVKAWYKTLVFNYCEIYGFQCGEIQQSLIGCEFCKLNEPCKTTNATHGTCSGRQECKFSRNKKIIGNTFKLIENVYSASDCCLKCQQHPRCGAFTWAHQKQGETNYCWLKTHVNSKNGLEANGEMTSGIVTIANTPKTFQRYANTRIHVYTDLAYYTTTDRILSVFMREAVNLDDCEAKCFMMKECFHYNYDSVNDFGGRGNCELLPSLVSHDLNARKETQTDIHAGTVMSYAQPSWNPEYQIGT